MESESERHLAINAARPEEGGVEHVRAIGGSDDHHSLGPLLDDEARLVREQTWKTPPPPSISVRSCASTLSLTPEEESPLGSYEQAR
jgi:hypothetical protein